MKKLLYIMIAVVTLVSCDDFLEVEPQQSQDLASIFDDPGNYELALVGAYNRAQDLHLFGTDFNLNADLLSNNINWVGSFTGPTQISNLSMTVFNANADGTYADTYRMMNNVNNILANIETADLPQSEIDRIRGEALFLRGATMFEAVRYFGHAFDTQSTSDLGLPIILTPVIDSESAAATAITRNTVAEVYTQAVADITAAEGLLPASNGNGRANSWVANAYLMKIAFQQRDYTTASTIANDIITNGPYSLVGSVSAIYTSEFSNESIWEIDHTVQDNPGTNGSLPTFYNASARGDITITTDLFTAFNDVVPAAQRTAVTTAGFTVADERLTELTAGNFVTKYESFANDDDNAIMSRLAEVMLVRAECVARAATTVAGAAEAITLLNSIRERSIKVLDGGGNEQDNTAFISYAAGDFADLNALIDAIVLERRIELAFEGDRFHDLNRRRQAIKTAAYRAGNTIFPIPQDVIDNNAAMVQNPFYQ